MAGCSKPADKAEPKAEVHRYALINSTFPISRAVEVPGGKTLLFHSGMTPDPAKPDAEKGSAEYWGDTKTQALSVLTKTKASVESMGLTMGDAVKMTVFLVGPTPGAAMDFAGMMEAYTQFFGTADQPNLPARSAVQVAGLAAPGMLVEIEIVFARP
ncbi:RidA family protein [Hydrocarboniphaga sp.]|uniref:RidA family protein n=1 Tax=Hydrocarboniphaga sp. TaxID=2033016 RepID=UPI002632DFB3|nr:RidA family protein [Hydrocarboniphaga sp.]